MLDALPLDHLLTWAVEGGPAPVELSEASVERIAGRIPIHRFERLPVERAEPRFFGRKALAADLASPAGLTPAGRAR